VANVERVGGKCRQSRMANVLRGKVANVVRVRVANVERVGWQMC
jgi:hypothetical protein